MQTRAAKSWLQHAGGRLLDLAYSPSCVACGAGLNAFGTKASLCRSCYEQLAFVTWPTCRRCAARVPEIPGSVDECGHCREENFRFDRTLSLGAYEGLLRTLLLEMKRDPREVLAHTFARLLQEHLEEQITLLQADVIVPIPMHRWRRMRRRTNPADAMAALLGRINNLPVAAGLLQMQRNTRTQQGLSQPGRRRNIRGALQIRQGCSLESAHVLLLDDVMTSGATCSEAARVLKRCGAKEVTALVVGRPPLH